MPVYVQLNFQELRRSPANSVKIAENGFSAAHRQVHQTKAIGRHRVFFRIQYATIDVALKVKIDDYIFIGQKGALCVAQCRLVSKTSGRLRSQLNTENQKSEPDKNIPLHHEDCLNFLKWYTCLPALRI